METPNSDRVVLYAGDDTASGRAGKDVLVGGPGEDQLFGASGNDTIYTGTPEEGDGESDKIVCGDENEDTVYLSGKNHSWHNIDSSCENVVS